MGVKTPILEAKSFTPGPGAYNSTDVLRGVDQKPPAYSYIA